MSTQPSIPTSPPPGKDPPSSSPPPAPTQNFLPLSSENDRPPSTIPDLQTKESADTKAMPPPPIPNPQHRPKPVITTQQASSSNIHSFEESQATATALQSADLHTSNDREKEKERPPFTPFFTLVNDLSNGEQSTHHPAQVHYLFSDDDASEVLTGALLRSMNTHSTTAVSSSREGDLEGSANTTSSGSSATFRKDGTRIRSEKGREGWRDKAKGREERVVIVDINEAGDGITSVSSLTPSWAVLNAEIGKAPTWDGTEQDGDQQAGAGGLMLKIEGVGLDCGDAGTFGAGIGGGGGGAGGKGKGRDDGGKDSMSGGRESGIGEDEMHALVEGFDRKMGVLRSVVRLGSRESLVEGEQS